MNTKLVHGGLHHLYLLQSKAGKGSNIYQFVNRYPNCVNMIHWNKNGSITYAQNKMNESNRLC